MATTISTTLAAGSVASPYFYDARITKQLCSKTCAKTPPVFAPTFSVVSTTNVGTGQYEVICNVSGVITYTPCGSCSCNAKSQLVNENFVLPLYSATAPTAVTISGSTIATSIQTTGCSNCGNVMNTDCALTLTVTTT